MSIGEINIAFMFPPGGEILSFGYHLGTAYIQAFLAKRGITSKQVIPPNGSTLQDCVNQALSLDPSIVGFTCYDDNYYLVHRLASLLKQIQPRTVIIGGGPSATFSDELILRHTPTIDVLVRYEGEETTYELISRLLNGGTLNRLDDIAGISFRRGNSIFRSPIRPLFMSETDEEKQLDGLPSPYLEKILNGSENTGILTTRGCRHQCTYCNFSAMSRSTVRYHSIDRVIAELKVLEASMKSSFGNSSLRPIYIQDDAFTLNSRRAKEICRRIIHEGINLQLACLCRADNLDEDLVELLKQAGFNEISFGLESAIPKVLRNVKKVCDIPLDRRRETFKPERRFLMNVKKGISLARRHQMKTSISIILGLPGENEKEGRKTLKFIESLNVDEYSHNLLKVFPGTELFDRAHEYGIRVEPSQFLLPYRTIHAYPVSKIPFLYNSSVHRQGRFMARTILRAFGGSPGTFSSTGRGICFAIMEVPYGHDFNPSFTWLKYSLSVNAPLVILGGEAVEYEDLAHMLRAVCDSSLPSTQLIYLRNAINENELAVYEMLHDSFRKHFKFPLVQLSKWLSLNRNIRNRGTWWPIYFLKERTDVNMLSALASRFADIKKTMSTPYFPGVFLDGCRWTRQKCPATEMKRVIINQTGEIRPCLTGQFVGTTKDDMKKLQKRVSETYWGILNKRKCEKCPVQSQCAKCLFPHPIDPAEYCEIQKHSPWIQKIVMGSNLMNTFNPLVGDL